MKKISIVGVDGSGKTVLMTALGDKYEKPDEFGIFLSPETPEAFGYVKVHMTRLHHGQWPSSTVVGQSSVLDWGLFRQNGTERVRLCDLSFLDFSGEVYRLAFGAKGDHDDATYTDKDVVSGIGTLQTHLQTSDTLLVLVNLKDIINGNAEEARTREAMWLSKGILDYAIDKLQIRHVAVAFTQADAYRATMDACDNVKNVYKTYLPFVASKYPDLPLFAVSAVNKTVPDDKGLPCPAEGFGSEGLDLLMEWIVSTVPGCENLISDIKKAPALCHDKVRMLCDEYVQLLVDDSQMRSPVLDSMQGSLHEMEVAIRAYPSFPQGLEILEQLQGQLRDMRVFEKEYAVLSNRAPYLANSQLEQTMDELCVGNSFVEKNRRNIVDALQTIKRDSSARRAKLRRRKCIAAVWLLLVLIASAAGGYLWYLRLEAERRDLMEQEKDSQNRIERGWAYRMEKGYKIAEWKPGEYHSQTQYLKAAEKPDTWISTRPGYVWTEGVNIVWKPGIRHLQTKDLVAAKEKDKWISTKPGYVWISGTKVSWKPGEYHPQTTDLKSGLEEGTWVSTKPGYVWAGGTDIVAWKPGEYHPKTNNLKAGLEEGTWVSTKPGYAWAGGMNIVWNPGVYHSQTTDLKAGQEEGTWVSTKPGYIWTGGVNIAWKKGLTSDEYPHWITVEEEGKWRLEDGYKYRNPDGQNVEEKGAIWNSSWVSADGRKRASSTEGRFEYQSKCDSCDGRGQKTVTENCPKCKGTQTVTSFKKCINCDGSGSKKVMLDCDECRYGIVEETCYECVNGFVDCDQCGGAGAFAVMGPWGMVMTEPCKKCWGQRMLRHAKCNGTGKILKKCIFCGGKGKIQSREDCEKCDGDGRIEKEERCWTCDANGKVERIVDCRRCNGTGKVWK